MRLNANAQTFPLVYKDIILLSHLEDIKNRNRHNNIRIRGIPEGVLNKDIDPTLQKIFSALLGAQDCPHIELDRAHCSLGPRSNDGGRPSDISCKVHYFKQKKGNHP